MEIHERIKARRKELKLSAEQVADRMGVDPTTVYRYESKSIKSMGIDKIGPIAKALETTPAKLMGWDTEPIIDETRSIDVYGSIPAGVPREAINDIVGKEQIPYEWLKSGGEFYALKVTGDSMYPKYFEGDIIVIRLQEDCESGQDAIVFIDDNVATLKTIIKENGKVRLQPINPAFPPKTLSPERVKILGIVKQIKRSV